MSDDMRSDLPIGTVTFLFTDVEGSTRLLNELGDARYADVLAGHRLIVRGACRVHGGVEVDTQGDAFLFAFPTAPGAIAAAAEITGRLAQGPVRVRVGLHTGTPILTEEGYTGIDLHRAARIAAAGSGGQVLVSASTASLADGDLRDLGEHRFKDLAAPEHVFQLGSDTFPPLQSLHRTNLPITPTPFLGRHRELREVITLLASDDLRLVTLTGPGGTGKTRLGIQAAAEASDRYPDGVWWVPLGALRDPDLVPDQAAQILGARIGLAEYIAEKRMLCVFDNFEQVVEAAGALSQLMLVCPNLHLLVTSRERLRVRGEQTYPVPPLTETEGEALFAARARAVDPAFVPTDEVRELCRRLDELPLALELAAARTALFTPQQLLDRLSQRLDLLEGERDADPRQRTLRATIEWSHELLTEDEQKLFRRLSVFEGGCSYEAADRVAEADPGRLQSLLDKSLLRRRDSEFGARYWMLETIREFGLERLAASQEADTVRGGHLDYFLALVEEAEPRLTGRDQQEWFKRLTFDQENIRAALEFACDRGDGERALMMAGTVWRFWWTRGQIDEAGRWYERAFAVGKDASDVAQARGWFGLAHVAEAHGDVALARVQFERAAEMLRRLGETRWLILALTHLAGTYEIQRAIQTQRGALALAESSGDLRGAAIVKGNLATALLAQGREPEAVSLLEEALDGHRALGDVFGMSRSLADLATLAMRRGDLDLAAARLRESVELSDSIGDTLSLSSTLARAAALILVRGDPESAVRLAAADAALIAERGFEADPVLDEARNDAKTALGERFETLWAEGKKLDLATAINLAMTALDSRRQIVGEA